MLNRKCEKQIEEFTQKIGKFVKKGDFNVRVTIIEKSKSRFTQKSKAEGDWKKAFRDSIGKGIINDSKNLYSVECITENGEIKFDDYGSNIINEIWLYVKDQDIARINLHKLKDLNDVPEKLPSIRSWVIIRE